MHQRGGQRGKSHWEAEQKIERMGEKGTWSFQTSVGTEKAWWYIIEHRNYHCQGFKNKRPNSLTEENTDREKA